MEKRGVNWSGVGGRGELEWSGGKGGELEWNGVD